MTTCCICLCEISDECCFMCFNDTEQHFYCTPCMETYLGSDMINETVLNFWEKNETIKCSYCDFGISEDQFLYSPLVKLYSKISRSISNSIIAKQTKAMMVKSNSDCSQTLINEILGLLTTCIACPNKRCRQPFYDFDGCAALTCSFCHTDFCGICLKIHPDAFDSHDMVKSHTLKMTPEMLELNGFTDVHFMTSDGWKKNSERLKIKAIVEYLQTIRVDILWASFDDIIQVLRSRELLTESSLKMLEEKVYSHNVNGVHLIRLPIVFWTIYSAKHYKRIEDVIAKVELSVRNRISLGMDVLEAVKRKYPKWKQIKHPVPGEDFSAINYPPEMYPIIFSAVTKWGRSYGFW